MKNMQYIPNDDLMNKYSDLRDDYNRFVREAKRLQQSSSDFRIRLSSKYLRGRGIEVGGFHAPLFLEEGCEADYVDKVDINTLKKWMPETNELFCVFPSIIDDGEILDKVESNKYDFLIANHMLEHTENVFQTIENHIRVVKDGGYLFYALPDKNYTFDVDRPLTSYEHLKDEYYNGVESNRTAHYREFGKLVSKLNDENELNHYVETYIKENRDIHFHVWNREIFFEQINNWIDETDLNIEILENAKNGIEFIIVLRILTRIEVAERLINKNELGKAKKILSDIEGREKKDLNVKNDLVIIAILENDFVYAEKLILQILEIDPNNEIALNNLQYLKQEKY